MPAPPKTHENWTIQEKWSLLELLRKYGEPIINKKSLPAKQIAWEKICKGFLLQGHQRTQKQVKDMWKRMKQNAKTLSTKYLKEKNRTGGGPPLQLFTDLDKAVVELIPIELIEDINIYDGDNSLNEQNCVTQESILESNEHSLESLGNSLELEDNLEIKVEGDLERQETVINYPGLDLNITEYPKSFNSHDKCEKNILEPSTSFILPTATVLPDPPIVFSVESIPSETKKANDCSEHLRKKRYLYNKDSGKQHPNKHIRRTSAFEKEMLQIMKQKYKQQIKLEKEEFENKKREHEARMKIYEKVLERIEDGDISAIKHIL